jgi:enamine deaminase RidA (YjgF/YER057c/UK114 family)
MICDNTQLAATKTEPASPIRMVKLERPPLTEYFITALPSKSRSIAATLREVAGLLREYDAQIVWQEVCASVESERSVQRAVDKALGPKRWPVTWIDSGDEGFAGTQIWAISGARVRPLATDGDIVGTSFEDRYATYCRLGGLVSSHLTKGPDVQAGDVFGRMERTLSAEQMEFGHTLRTWFYLDDILSWYGDFNGVRDGFFRQRGVFDRLVPASTGIGAANPAGSALVAGLLAARPKNGCMTARALPSPLQCPALDYGSSFSRAVELDQPDHRRIYVSGTASIAPEGHTIHVGQVEPQIAKTVEVVAAILQSRDMQWSNVTRGIAYVREAADMPLYDRYCAAHGLPAMPVVAMTSTICRDDLLFELELDAVKKR